MAVKLKHHLVSGPLAPNNTCLLKANLRAAAEPLCDILRVTVNFRPDYEHTFADQ